ncbi:MAG: ABC transporter substrate-binding protein [Treponema sp.]|nr:ABC transporter substrate-binding protein [Treponema sp.]
MSPYELEGFVPAGPTELLAKLQFRPFPGFDYAFVPGEPGGTWNTSMINEPRTFNRLVAEGDADSMAIQDRVLDSLAQYDTVTTQWVPRLATWEVVIDKDADTLDIIYTLRDGLYWTYYASDVKIPVTSDDFVFWHNEITGDVRLRSSGYSAQYVMMPDGTSVQRRAYRVDDRSFRIHFPRIVANPVFTTNMTVGPRHHFEPALRQGGPDAVRDLFNISVNPRTLPSMGAWHVTEYSQGQRIVFARNPHFWERDANDVSVAYPDRQVVRILPDRMTQKLVFMQGHLETFSAMAEDISAIVNHPSPDWTMYHNDGAMGSNHLWTFNQNPLNAGEPWHYWFSKTEFRQAMSSMLDRDRIISQVHRGLAMPMYWWFPPANEFYNPDIRLQWTHDRRLAVELLASVGMTRDPQGVMRDSQGRPVEFNISFPAGVGLWGDIAAIIVDELATIGVTVTPVPTDFQRLVAQLMSTFDWQTLMIGLTGGALFPTEGTNVWLSSGNLHMWHPFQETPYHDWEARKDWLFREGMFTYDPELAQPLWDEFQELMLYQMPLIWMARVHGFVAVNNRWSHANFFFDNSGGARVNRLFTYR